VLAASALTRSQCAAMNLLVWLPLLVGVRGAVASSTLGAFSQHALYTRDVLRAVMSLSSEQKRA
jgi:hypothetical protein